VGPNVHAILDPLRLAVSFPQALARLLAWRPDAIFTTGGFVTVPVLLAAALIWVPVVLWEGNAVPGRSVRVTGRLARVKAVSFGQAGRRLGGTWRLTGTPIRALPEADRETARVRLGLPTALPCVLVFGGSQEVRRFNHAVRQALPQLAARAAVVHVTGPSAIGEFAAVRDALPEELRPRYLPVDRLGEEMADALVAADIVVGRAGSSTLAEVCAVGRAMVVVPYPHAAGHQAANARVMAEAGAALLVEDEAFDGAALLRAVELLDQPERLAAMADAARALARPGAAAAVAALVVAVARGEAPPSSGVIETLSKRVA
jgi:UDP-N-acetylglucosamine--N-acetylmuramyl-(pentapeptide) pyrophosphoryl-undecaprenol N-acetylglucosamine transferase